MRRALLTPFQEHLLHILLPIVDLVVVAPLESVRHLESLLVEAELGLEVESVPLQ